MIVTIVLLEVGNCFPNQEIEWRSKTKEPGEGVTHQAGFLAKGNPATKAARIPMQIKSWLTEPSVPRISVGEICKVQEVHLVKMFVYYKREQQVFF
jgi:hypothetical protein